MNVDNKLLQGVPVFSNSLLKRQFQALTMMILFGHFICPLTWAETPASFKSTKEASTHLIAKSSLLANSVAEHPKLNSKITVEIPLLTLNGSALTLPGVINQAEIGMFVIDTGATHTVITPAVAARLGIEVSAETPRVPVITANGKVLAPVITLKEVFLGHLRIVEAPAVVLDLGGNEMLIGLLGMDVLSKLDYSIQSDKLTVSH